MNPVRGDIGEVLVTPQFTVEKRWLWTGTSIEELEPVQMRSEPNQ